MPEHEEREDEFGFGSLTSAAKERIQQIKPALPSEQGIGLERIDAVAEIAGFVSREALPAAYEYRYSRQQRPEPRIPLNMRVPISLGTSFQRFCEENRYSYPEGLAEIMRLAGLAPK